MLIEELIIVRKVEMAQMFINDKWISDMCSI